MAKQKGSVTFNDDLCKGCGLCVTVCPTKILFQDPDRLNKKGYHPIGVTEMDKCIACINCALICPDLVITVEKQEESKEALAL
ncbi:4Fe-4S binding protein [Tissierella sp. Yu-01]|uniref:4Fe-4S binding protein n=1 Tax=Tissierella sp. Yu-01 TaxID=3035694 RepID=UPI00240D3292|nr:4Fe-4S binding protein [Tissierella sp. Yu-01]WFA10306.1 4Fe-4S dicluster domain-containing protein [Tissierella sp. Yu-01]